MAAKPSRYGRRLIVFLIGVAVMYGGVALIGVWQPKLGLDLQGGTRITLQAQTEAGQNPTPESLSEAASIIDQRVNATGVAESEVSTQGSQNIVVEIPGEPRGDIAETVARSAQLYFRLVADVPAQYMVPAGTDQGGNQSGDQSGNRGAQSGDGQGKKNNQRNQDGNQSEPKGRALSEGLLAADQGNTPSPTPSVAPEESPAGSPTEAPTPDAGASAGTGHLVSAEEALAWQASPGQQWLEAYQKFTCPADGGAPDVVDDPSKPLITCDEAGQKYLLTAAVIDGKQLDDASYGIPQQGVGWVVTLDFDGTATKVFADVTRAINLAYNSNGTQKQFAIVLDGEVLSAPTVSNGAITGGSAEISGDFTQESAASLANSLKYGALPLKFEIAEVSEEGPTLAADQLTGALWAGGIGLALVLAYCMFYYRGLGLVVVGSLAAAGALTYAAVLLLAKAADFTLTLPGIAGLIVGIGITADSFIVYFERIRDEMRDGKSMRVAVESGWVRARNTCLAADAVTMLAAVVLFIFAIGVVKGFAFALGLSTAIDLVVFFLFTKPMVSWFARFRFFNAGHRMSGLSAEHIGIERIGSARPAGGHPA